MGAVSTSPVFHRGKNVLRVNFSNRKEPDVLRIIIDHDVWIGARTLIKSGVHIGTGSIIGMGSVVTKDIPSYEIWAGNPARRIRSRFSEEAVLELLSIKWWEWSDEKLMKMTQFFDSPEKLIGATIE